MATARDGPNPLRPYYKPPSIGIPPEIKNSTSTSSPQSAPVQNGTTSSIRASARDMFPDIDYTDYLSDSSPSTSSMFKELLDEGLSRYGSILLGHPFEVAKIILQIRSQTPSNLSTLGLGKKSSSYRDPQFSDLQSDEDSDPDEPAYFTSSNPSSNANTRYSSRQPRGRDRYQTSSPSPSPTRPPPSPTHQLLIKRPDSVIEVIGQLWQKEAAWGVWKGTNTTFVYAVLNTTLESWIRGVLSAIMNLPDAGIIAGAVPSMDDSPYPWASLGVALGAAAITALALAPLDLIRTKLIVTPTSSRKRSLYQNLRSLQSYLCAPTLLVPTLLLSIIDPAISCVMPPFVRSRFGIDQTLTPTSYSFASVVSCALSMFVKLPLETVLRRGQVSVLASREYLQSSGENSLDAIVEVGPYNGVMGTMWSIVKEEGVRSRPEIITPSGARKPIRKSNRAPVKGQGVQGLWRGWRVGMWGLVGLWGAEMMGTNSVSGGEF